MISRERLRDILACPACRGDLGFQSDEAVCSRCQARYPHRRGSWWFVADAGGLRPGMNLHDHLSGRSRRLEETLLGRAYRALYVHPSRYIGDLQRRSGIPNFHRTLDRFLRAHGSGSVLLDIGSGARRLGPDVLRLDLDSSVAPDLVADAHKLPLRAGTCDAVVVQEVLEHTEWPQEVLSEVHRVLRPGGRIYCEVPFLYPVHHRQDFYRWTLAGLELACGQFEREWAGVVIGPFAALNTVLRSAVTHRCRSIYVEAVVDLLFGWLTAPLKWLDAIGPVSVQSVLGAGAVGFIGAKR